VKNFPLESRCTESESQGSENGAMDLTGKSLRAIESQFETGRKRKNIALSQTSTSGGSQGMKQPNTNKLKLQRRD